MLNQLEFQRYIQASAKRANLSVIWQEGVIPHANDKGQIVLPKLPADASEEDYRLQLHIATHEASHVLYTDFDPFKTVNAGNSFLGHIFNAVEDVRIEWLNAQEYEGDRSNSDRVYPNLFSKMFTKLEKMPKAKHIKMDERLDKIVPVLWFLVKAQSELYASGNLVLPRVEKQLTPKGQEYVDKIKAGTYFDEMRVVRDVADPQDGTAASLKLAKRIFTEVFGEDAEKEMKKLEEQRKKAEERKGSPKKKGDKGDGKGKGKGKEKDAGDADAGDGDGEGDPDTTGGDGSDSTRTGDDIPTVSYQEWLPNEHEMKPTNERTPVTGHHVDYSGYVGSHSYIPATKDDYFVADFCKNKFTAPLRRNDDLYTPRAKAALGGNGARFAAQIRTRLQIRSKDRFEFGVKRGKLQNSLLHRVTIPNAGSLNERVFKRRIMNDTLDTAVVWLGDGSGSMSGRKYAQLIAASVRFNEAVGNILGIPIEIHSFSTRCIDGTEQPAMYVHRDFSTRKLGEDELMRRMSIAGNYLYNNADGDSILWSYDRLRAVKAKRKLLIVASDGSPCCGRSGDIDWYTRKVVKEIEQSPIEIVGIGIMDRNVSRIYKEHYVIGDAAELEKALLTLIDKKIR